MKIRPSAAFSVQLTKPFPSGCVLSPLAPLARPFGGGKVLTAEQGSSAMLWCSSPSTHRLGISPQARGILWPAVEWALCSRAHVLALALNPLQFLSQLSPSPRWFTLGWREEGHHDLWPERLETFPEQSHAPSNAFCLALSVWSHGLLASKKHKAYLMAWLSARHWLLSWWLLRRVIARHWFLGQEKLSLWGRDGLDQQLCGPQFKFSPSPVLSGAKGSYCSCWLCQVGVTWTVGLS